MVKRLATRHVLYAPRQHEDAATDRRRRIVAQFNFSFLDAAVAPRTGTAPTPRSASQRIVSWQHLNLQSRLRFFLMMQIAAYYGRLKRGKRVIVPSDEIEDAMDLDTAELEDGGAAADAPFLDSELYFEPLLNANDDVVGIRGTVATARGLTVADEDAFAKAYGAPEIVKKYAKAAKEREKRASKNRDRPDPECEDGDAEAPPPKKKRRFHEVPPALEVAEDRPSDTVLPPVIAAAQEQSVAADDDLPNEGLMDESMEVDFEETLAHAHEPEGVEAPLEETTVAPLREARGPPQVTYKMWLMRAGKMVDIEVDGLFHQYIKLPAPRKIAIGPLAEPWATLRHLRLSTFDEIATRYYQRDGDGSHEAVPHRGSRWTAQEALHGHLPEETLPEYQDSFYYYDTVDEQEDLKRCGSLTPSRWPHPEHIVVLRPKYARFELMVTQPLPFAIGLKLDIAPYAGRSAVDAMVEANPALLTNLARGSVSVVDERSPQERTDALFNELMQHAQSTAATEQDAEWYRALMTMNQGLQNPNRLRDQQEAYALPETRKQVLLRYIRDVKQDLFERVAPLERGSMPGVLEPAYAPPPADPAAADGPIEVHILPPSGEPEDENVRVSYQVQREDRNRRIAELYQAPGDAPLPENPALLGRYQEMGDVDAAAADGMTESELLMREALRVASRANLGMGPEILVGDDFMKKAVINQAAFADLETKCRDDGLTEAQTQEAMRLKIDQVGRESLALFWRAETTAPALKAIRQSIIQVQQTADHHSLMPGILACQDLINGSSFQTALVYLHNTAMTHFKMTPLTCQYFVICYFAAKGALTLRNFGNGVAPPSIALLGNAMVGKSFILGCVVKTHLPGSMISANHISPQAFQSAPNLSHWFMVIHELPKSLMFDNHDTSSGGGKASKDASSSTNDAFKTMATEGMVTSVVLHIDPDTKKRATETRVTVCSIPMLAAVNWEFSQASGPARSRFLGFELPATGGNNPSEDARCKKRPSSLENDPVFARIIYEHHCLHAHYTLLRMLLNMRVWPGGVVAIGGELLSNLILRALEEKGSLPPENFSTRKEDKVLQIAEILCVWAASFELMATRKGHIYLHESGEHGVPLSPYSWKAMNEFCAPRLVITKEHVVFALTLLDGQFDDMHSTDVLTVLADILGVRGKTYTATTPTPLVCRPTDMVGALPSILEAVGIISPPPVSEPVVVADAVPTIDAAGVRTVNAVLTPPRSSAAHAGTPMETEVPDYRYVTSTFPSDIAFQSKLTEGITHHRGVKLRPEFIKATMDKHKDMTKMSLESPFYQLNATKTGIEPRRDRITGVIHKARIPALIIKEIQPAHQYFGGGGKRRGGGGGAGAGGGAIQVSLSVEFIARRLLLPMAESHVKELSDMLGLETMEPKLRKSYEERMEMAPDKRLEREVFEINPLWKPEQREEQCHAFAQRISECDVRAHPMAAAINSVLSHPALGQTEHMPLGRAALLNSSSQIRRPAEDYVVAYRVPNIRLRNGVRAEELMSLGKYFQRLSVRRNAATPRVFLAIENNVQPSLTAQYQLSRIAAIARGPIRPGEAPAGIDTWNQTPSYFADLDFDFIGAVERMKSIGSPMESKIEWQWRVALNIPSHEPLIYAPNLMAIGRLVDEKAQEMELGKCADEAIRIKHEKALKRLKQHPERDIGDDLLLRLSIWDDEKLAPGKYVHTRPISEVLIHSPYVARSAAAASRGAAAIESGNLEDEEPLAVAASHDVLVHESGNLEEEEPLAVAARHEVLAQTDEDAMDFVD